VILKPVDLFEWQTREVDSLEGIDLNFDKEAERIASELASSDKLEILQLKKGIQIRATSWVGRITLDGLTISVRPKIDGVPLLNLLRYTYSLRDLHTFTPTDVEARTNAFQDLIVEQLANEAAELLSRGLHRDYLRFHAQLARPTGRIDFSQVAVSLANAKSVVACTYYNRSDAILLNRVLLAGLRLAARLSTDSQLTARVFRLAQILGASVPTMRLTQVDLDNAQHVIDRRSTAYSSALTLIDLLVKGMGASLAQADDRVQMPGFLFDMNRFFQALISRFLHEELPEFSIQDEHRLKGIFEYDPANNPQRRRAVVPRPDFALLSHGKVIEFLDAKYRDLWDTSLPREMLYQLAIYALSKDTGIPRATILYPTLAGEAIDQIMLLKEPILGHRRAEITLRPVNLLKIEKLVRPHPGALIARQRQNFARALVFGGKSETQFKSLAILAS
jgi:5-methylcytosine-specific restriction enzyme subunit McrC